MPTLYYAVRETDSYADAVLHSKRGCPDGPVRAAPRGVEGERCPDCTADGESETEDEDGTAEPVGSEDATEWADRPAAAVEAGICPWCEDDDDRYEGEHVGQHASSSHPEAWAEYRDA
jgi:hypothetical protein